MSSGTFINNECYSIIMFTDGVKSPTALRSPVTTVRLRRSLANARLLRARIARSAP